MRLFRLLLVRVAEEKALPFELLAPNEKTIAAMKAARNRDMKTTTIHNLLDDLNAND